MVELHDRINKPRALRGTPTYAFVNRAAAGIVCAGIVIGSLMGLRYYYVQKRDDPNFMKISLRSVHEESQEERVKKWVSFQKQMIKAGEEMKEDEMYRPR